MRPRASYHHGDARNALVAAAEALLAKSGAAGLSLRAVAEAAGLSRQAPYNHFADKEDLLAHLAAEGFRRLGNAMWQIANAPRLAPSTKLARAAEAYIAFAANDPAMFRLMFSRELVDIQCHVRAREASRRAYAALEAIIAAIAPPDEGEGLSLAAWSLVHGYATLRNEAGMDVDARVSHRAAEFARLVVGAARARSRD